MTRWFTIDVRCSNPDCGETSPLLVDYEERDLPAQCPACKGVATRVWSVPNMMTAAWPDGKKRPDVRRLAEASRLEAESFDLPPEKRKEHQKEIRRLKSAKTK